jgi:L-rhamnose mutarotase
MKELKSDELWNELIYILKKIENYNFVINGKDININNNTIYYILKCDNEEKVEEFTNELDEVKKCEDFQKRINTIDKCIEDIKTQKDSLNCNALPESEQLNCKRKFNELNALHVKYGGSYADTQDMFNKSCSGVSINVPRDVLLPDLTCENI